MESKTQKKTTRQSYLEEIPEDILADGEAWEIKRDQMPLHPNFNR